MPAPVPMIHPPPFPPLPQVAISPHVYGPSISLAQASQTEKYKGAAYWAKLSASFGYLNIQVGMWCHGLAWPCMALLCHGLAWPCMGWPCCLRYVPTTHSLKGCQSTQMHQSLAVCNTAISRCVQHCNL
jgi:hypothetical protein